MTQFTRRWQQPQPPVWRDQRPSSRITRSSDSAATAQWIATAQQQLDAALAEITITKPEIAQEPTSPEQEEITQLQAEVAALKQALAEAEYNQSHDALTGLLNRRGGDAALEKTLVEAQEQQTPITFAILDIDHFKKVNDTYGHTAGDRVLQEFAERMRNFQKEHPEISVTLRQWGEEFAVMIQGASQATAENLLNDLREKIRQNPILIDDTLSIFVTTSIGACYAEPQDLAMTEENPDRTLLQKVCTKAWKETRERADSHLYGAKNNGRDQVHMTSLRRQVPQNIK